jgi:hypothetical protein
MRPTKALQHFMAERAHVHGTIKVPGTSHPTARRPHGAGRPSGRCRPRPGFAPSPIKKVTT